MRSLAVALGLCALLQAPAPAPWLGASVGVEEGAVTVGERTVPRALRVAMVVPGSPADAAGLRTGDLVVAAADLDFAQPADGLVAAFRAAILRRKPGDAFPLTALRDRTEPRRETLVCAVTLGTRPEEATERALPESAAIFPAPPPRLAEEALAAALVARAGLDAPVADLRARLARLGARGDPWRLPRVAYAFREPYTMGPLAERMADVPADLPGALRHAAEWLAVDATLPAAPPLAVGLTPEAHAAQIAGVLDAAATLHAAAFAGLSADERAELLAGLPVLSTAFIAHVMPLGDDDRARLARVQRTVALAARVDTGRLVAAALRLATLAEPAYLAGLAADLAGAPGAEGGIFLQRDTPHGKIVFAGRAATWHREAAAVCVDLGGDDFHAAPAAAPFALLLDLGGDDAYEATFDVAAGATHGGVALLVDATGNDTYCGQRWSQGAAAVGVAVCADRAGDDRYRAADYAQGTAFRGVGLLLDEGGDDRYAAPRYAQAVGLPGGFGALIDRAGRDEYFVKGRDPTGYGDAGIFDAWGQGCAIGFRQLASGGCAVLRDDAGDDRYEAGNFSQGGGYYFGWGTLVDRQGADTYVGSRYAQAFAAHQALGYFADHAGNDRYGTRQGVAQSCAWDESITTFLDRAGDDIYDGGVFFSHGAAAHNGLALLLDLGGRDRYRHAPGRARAGPNDYHGGWSLALTLDYGGATDEYDAGQRNDAIAPRDGHGFACDIPVADAAAAIPRLAEWWPVPK